MSPAWQVVVILAAGFGIIGGWILTGIGGMEVGGNRGYSAIGNRDLILGLVILVASFLGLVLT